MSNPRHFIVIDDDPVNNYICKIVLNKIFHNHEFISFTVPENGVRYMESELAHKSSIEEKTVVLLDLNMPGMTGWEVLEHFDRMNEEVKDRVKIYILSSSIEEIDKERAKQNKYVQDYIVKPLTFEIVQQKFV